MGCKSPVDSTADAKHMPECTCNWIEDTTVPVASDGPLPPLTFVPTVPELIFTKCTSIPTLCYIPVQPGPLQDVAQLGDWVRQVHPIGRVYIYNESRRTIMSGDIGLLRDDFGRPNRVRQLSEPAMDELWDGMKKHVPDNADMANYELFLSIDVLTDPAAPKVSYYFVEWPRRILFWLHEFLFEYHPSSSIWHMRNMLEYQFWAHVDTYPMHHSLPPNAREELEAVLAYQTIESKTFRESTAPWKPEETHMLVKTLPSVEFAYGLPPRRPSMDSEATASVGQFIPTHEGCANAAVARLWRQIYLLRVQNFYGDEYARIGRTDRRRYTKGSEPPRWLRRPLSFFFFGRPPRFYSELQDAFVDEIMHLGHWRTFVEEEVQPEWTNNGFMATVMLAANMAFLALSGVDDGANSLQISCKILSLSSTIFSTATLFTTMRLIAFHQHFKTATTDEAMWYMAECSKGRLGLFSIAMLFSVPFTTFMLAMMTFIAAVLLFSFQHWTLSAGIPLVTTTIVPVAGILSWMFAFFASWSRTRKSAKPEWAASHAPLLPPNDTTQPHPSSASGGPASACGRSRSSTLSKWLPIRRKSTASESTQANLADTFNTTVPSAPASATAGGRSRASTFTKWLPTRGKSTASIQVVDEEKGVVG